MDFESLTTDKKYGSDPEKRLRVDTDHSESTLYSYDGVSRHTDKFSQPEGVFSPAAEESGSLVSIKIGMIE